MLYISRYIGVDRYGVVDTDDGVEEIVYRQAIERACEHLNIQINGVECSTMLLSHGETVTVNKVFAYQVPEMVTPVQVKTRLMRHVNVVTHNHMVTNILWEHDKITEPVTLRLSDYGDCCGDRILWGNANREVHKITLILDDKIKFTPKTFRLSAKENRWSVGVDGVGVLFDIRELTDNDAAKLIYHAVMVDEVFDDACMFSIVDSDVRKRKFKKELVPSCCM